MRCLVAAFIALLVVLPPSRADDRPRQEEPESTGPAATTADEPTNEQPDAAHQEEPGQESPRAKWRTFRDATRGLATWNLFGGRLTMRGFARVQVDGTKVRFDDTLAAANGESQASSIDLRRLSLNVTGTIDNHVRYVAGFEFGPDYGVSDLYAEGMDAGLRVFGYRVGDFRVGFFQEPFSLSRVTSSYASGFLERSLPTWTFGPGNNVGYMVHNRARKQRITWQAGFFSFGNENDANASTSSLSVTFRMTGRPLYRQEGRRLVHLGAAYSHRTPRGSTTQYRSRPEARFVDFLVDTGNLNSSTIQLLGLEAASVRGPLWIEAEVIGSRVTTANFGEVHFWGSSVEAGYFLTGEVRRYDVRDAGFMTVIPGSNYRKGLPLKRSNGGAFEVVGRLSNVDLQDGGVEGGKLRDQSLGFNWYVDASSRLMFNVIRADAGDRGKTAILLLRFQYNPRIH